MPTIKQITSHFDSDFGTIRVVWNLSYTYDLNQYNQAVREDEVESIHSINFIDEDGNPGLNIIKAVNSDKKLRKVIENMLLDKVQYVSEPELS